MLNNSRIKENRTTKAIIANMLLAAVSLFVNGFGVYLTIQANIGAAPWDVLNLGLSKSLGILYGTASVIVSYSILGIDIALKEPIGIAMFIDAVVVGKSVDFFNKINLIPKCKSPVAGIIVLLIGLVIAAYTQYTYMSASLGCGPRDTLLVALTKRAKKMPIGAVSIALLSTATFIGWLLGGPVGIGTIICALASGPIMQMAFNSVKFDATNVHHQHLADSVRVFAHDKAA
ncbi:YczE/YyaS/YitT family protein [Butyrivibrio sp. VCB2006]|uniref:YczE/YyaS/YitT family protein n=1 Tax=Butyrivibrio sp. VCB2006 TaxID=1280679 RepID=UPI000492DBAB|nr:membrane protein [Butyrivibrio sp. VCB2006]